MRMSILKKAAASLFGDAGVGDVLEDKTFQSITAGAAATGTMPNRGAVIMTPGTSDQTIQQGYHNGTGKILSLGGDAAAGDVLEDVTFSSDVAGREVAGTMPNRGGVVITPGTSDQDIEEGYHDGTGYVKGDVNLVAGNIKKDVKIFNVTGTMEPDSPPVGNAEEEHVLYGKTFESQAAGAGATGTMPNRGAVTITPGTTDQPIPAGYHNGSGKVKAKYSIRPSNTLQIYSDTNKNITSLNTPEKLKEIKIGKSGGCKVSFRLSADSGSTLYAQIYINGSPSVGVDYKCTSEMITFSQNIAVRPGDKIQIYGYKTSSYSTGRIANFRIYYDVEDNTTYTDDEVLLS